MANGHGGARPGSGRKVGAPNIKRLEPGVLKAGILPLEMRLRVARHMWAEAVDESGAITDLKLAKEAADFAEPALQYTSPRLANIEHTVDGEIRQRVISDKPMTAEDWARAYGPANSNSDDAGHSLGAATGTTEGARRLSGT